jgi:hypothetical protein
MQGTEEGIAVEKDQRDEDQRQKVFEFPVPCLPGNGKQKIQRRGERGIFDHEYQPHRSQ